MNVFGFVGYSGSGKTTLIEQLIPRLAAGGQRVSLIKHTHHDFDLDKPGKDSHRFRTAGAGQVLLAGAQRWALMTELRGAPEPSLEAYLAELGDCDWVLVEGFKASQLPKIEVHRPATGKEMLWPTLENVLAVASDVPVQTHLPRLDLNDVDAVAKFVVDFFKSKHSGV